MSATTTGGQFRARLARRTREYATGYAGIVLLLIIWELATRAGEVPRWLLPSPKDILVTFWQWKADLVRHTAVTMYETLAGFLIAVVVGVPLAALLTSSNLVWRTLYPVLTAIQSIPKTAIAPLLLVWIGAGDAPKIIIAFLISFFPIVVNTATGMMLVEPELVDVLRSLRASRLQEMWEIRLPNALPHIFSACKVGITLAVVGAVIGEFVGADAGLGYIILVASSQLKTDLAFVAIFLLSLLGMVLFWLVCLLEKWMVPWGVAEHQAPISI